ncbi:MAG: hypothetical protein U9N61_10105 [Euryarchaeota archaeon]|nr:hypothetical protein [Euryarchaeota archaeon]
MKSVENSTFSVQILCSDCGDLLNETRNLTYDEMLHDYISIVFLTGLAAGDCPNGCSPVGDDCNTNTQTVIVDTQTGCKVDYRMFKLLSGQFYSCDYGEVCDCPDVPPTEIYHSGQYPAVHARCGRWMKKYVSYFPGET